MQAYLLAPRFRGNRAKQIASAVLLAAALVLSITARKVPGFAQWYSTHLYPVWVGSLGRLTGYLPFSAAEILLYLLLAAIALRAVRSVADIRKKQAGYRGAVWDLLLLVAALCFL